MITTEWVISQIFAFLGLIFVVISFQQKETKTLKILILIAASFIFAGLCFLGNTSAIIIGCIGVIRNIISLFLTYKQPTNKNIKNVISLSIVLALIILNIIFWNNILNLLSILLGSLQVYTFMQESASKIRKYSVITEVVAIIYCALLVSPTNIIIEAVTLISAIIGIRRLDRKKNS